MSRKHLNMRKKKRRLYRQLERAVVDAPVYFSHAFNTLQKELYNAESIEDTAAPATEENASQIFVDDSRQFRRGKTAAVQAFPVAQATDIIETLVEERGSKYPKRKQAKARPRKESASKTAEARKVQKRAKT